VSDTCTGLLPEYGDDACGAATVSRQIPRAAKPVDVPGPLIRTGVQFPPSPKNTARPPRFTAEAVSAQAAYKVCVRIYFF